MQATTKSEGGALVPPSSPLLQPWQAVQRLDGLVVDRLEEACGLVEDPDVPADMCRVDGAWGAVDARLTTRFLRGDGALARLHVAIGSSSDPDAFASLTLLALGAPGSALPTLAIDLVAAKGRFALVSLDVVPVGGRIPASLDTVTDRRLRAMRNAVAREGEPLDRPDFLAGVASPGFVMARRVSAGTTLVATATYLDAYARVLASGEVAPQDPTDPSLREARIRYLEAMHHNDREERALGAVFGDDWARRFLRDWMLSPARVP